MLKLECLVRAVAQNPTQETNQETGAVTDIWKITTEHNDTKGDLQIQNLKAKTQLQADGWRKCLGKTVVAPVNIIVNKGKAYLWIEKGQLPMLVTPVASAAEYQQAKAV